MSEFNLVGAGTKEPFGGYVSAVDRTTVGRRFMVRGSKNVYLKKSGTIANRPGLKRRGSIDTTSADVKSSVTWDTSLGFTRPVQLSNGKIQVESDIVTAGTYVWYDLVTGVTSTRIIFDDWWDNTLKKDILLWCDGTADMKYWSGAIGLISSTTATTIVLTNTVASLGFSASGSVFINGTEYAYTGTSGSTLTGVTPDPTSQANGSVVIQKPVVQSNVVANDYNISVIKVINNQMLTLSDTSRLAYMSKNTDWKTFTKSSPRAVGEGDTFTLDEIPTGIGVRNGNPHIGTKKAWYIVSFKQLTLTGTAYVIEQTVVDKRALANNKGPLRHEFIGNDGSDILYVSADQQLRLFGQATNIEDPSDPSLSYDIEDELASEDFTGGHMHISGDFIYLTSPNNGRVWIHETMTRLGSDGNISRDRVWHAPFIWNLSRITTINGVDYGYSNANPQIYQLWDTLQWNDDAPSGEDLPYDSVLAMAYRRGNRDDLLEYDHQYLEGYMTEGTNLFGAYVNEYKGANSVLGFVVSEDENRPLFYTGDVGASLGDASLSDNPLGDQTTEEDADQEQLPKYRCIIDNELTKAHEFQTRLYTTEAGARWEVLCMGTNERISEEEPAYLHK